MSDGRMICLGVSRRVFRGVKAIITILCDGLLALVVQWRLLGSKIAGQLRPLPTSGRRWTRNIAGRI